MRFSFEIYKRYLAAKYLFLDFDNENSRSVW